MEDIVLNTDSAIVTSAALNFLNRGAMKILVLLQEEHTRMPVFYEEWIGCYLDCDFFSHFRMRKVTFYMLLNKVGLLYTSSKHTGGNLPLNLEKMLLIILWYLAKGEVIISIGDRFNVANSTVHSAITVVLGLINLLMSDIIKWPTENECEFIEQEFRSLGGYPGM